MTKAAKQIVFILGVVIIIVFAFGAFTWIQKSKLEAEVTGLNQRIAKGEEMLKQAAADKAKMQKDLQALSETNKTLETNNQNLEGQLAEAVARAQEIQSKIDELTQDRDKWERRANTITEERDAFMVKVNEMEARLKGAAPSSSTTSSTMSDTAAMSSETKTESYASSASSPVDEAYWADLVKAKADLEVKIESLKADLSKQEITIVDLKEENSALKIEIDSIKHDKEEISREIAHKESLINNISLELARARNDRKFVSDRVSKLNKENQELRDKMKQLVSTKSALEKSIVRLSEDKNQIEKKLGQSETIIQSKIDEIWDIKESIDQTFQSAKITTSSANEVELPPIVVNSAGGNSHYTAGANPGFNGRVVSINDENNFVIVDVGEAQGIRLGDTISVYRDSKYVARLEVIQVRKDISAADIKDQWSKIRVGDVVR